MSRIRKALSSVIFILFFSIVFTGAASGVDSQSIKVTLQVPQINWINTGRIKEPITSGVGFSSEIFAFDLRVAATGRSPRVITAKLPFPLPKGWKIMMRIQLANSGTSQGFRVLGTEEVVLLKDLWGVYDEKGTGEIKIETAIDSPPKSGRLDIQFRVRDDY